VTRRLLAGVLYLSIIVAAGCGVEDTTTTVYSTPPVVLTTSPSDGETEVSLNTYVSATFSEAMDTATTNPATFTLKDPDSNPVDGTITYTTTATAAFTPSSPLAYSTQYTASISDGAKDLGGNALTGGYEWSFTTAPNPDVWPPGVMSINPAYAETGVAVNTAVTVTFTEQMDPSSINTATFTLNGTGPDQVSGIVTYAGTTATFTPTGSLDWETTYTAAITAGAKDLAGNAMTSGYEWTFTTGATPDTTPPAITSTSPSDGATGIDVNTSVSATFSEAMDTATTNPATFTLKDSALNPVSGIITYTSSATARFTPASLLAYSTLYTAAISDGAKDLGGNALAGGFEWSFTTRLNPWTQLLGTSSDEGAECVAVDAGGAVYVAGYTKGGLDNNTNSGGSDLFLVKYDTSGARQWTQQLGTSGDDAAKGVAVDPSGNIYVAGYTKGGLDGNTNSGGSDLFLVKYDSSGARQWTQQLGTSGDDVAEGVAVDPIGNIYVAGYTKGGLDGNTSAGENDLFLVKYDSAGAKQWTRQLGSSYDDLAYSVAVDGSGNIYVTGNTTGGLDGNTSAGENDLFLVKYDSDGAKQWTRQLGTSSYDKATGVAVDGSGDIYVTGYTAGGLDGNTYAGWGDIFLVKYDSNGVKQWTQLLGSGDEDEGHGVAVDASGAVYVTGDTWGGLDNNANAGLDWVDIFLVKYDSNGVKQWTRQIGTPSNDVAYGVVVDGGYIYVAGYTKGGLDGNTNAGGSDIFLVKYDASGLEQ
jgi:hypothetical protein